MNFLNPLGLLGLIGIPIILILYLIRSRYKEKTVSSTFIWKRSLKYAKRRIPLNFILSLLLLLQILTVAVASLAIARPTISPWQTDEVIIVVDSSASMLTEDKEGKTRFELAKEEAKKIAEQADANKRVSVISAGEQAQSIIVRSDSRYDVIDQIDKMQCSISGTDTDGAIALVENIKKENMEAKVYFFTDRDFKSDDIEVKNFARSEDWNVAISSFTDSSVAGAYAFTADVISYGSDVDVILELYIDGKFIHSKEVSLSDTSSKQIIFSPNASETSQEGREYAKINQITSYDEARIQISFKGGVSDGLEFDNQYHIYSNEAAQPKALFASNYVGIAADGSVDSTKLTYIVQMMRICGFRVTASDLYSPQTYKNVPTNEAGDVTGYDLYVYDGFLPDKLPEDGAIWIFNPPSSIDELGITVSDTIEASIDGVQLDYSVQGTDSQIFAQIIKNVDASSIFVSEYRTLSYSDDMNYVPIFSDGEQPVVLAGMKGTQRIITVGFDMHNSNWPILFKDFSMFILNISNYSTPDYLEKRTYNVGETASFLTPVGAKSYKIWFNDLYGIFNSSEDGNTRYAQYEYDTAQDITLLLENVGVYEIEVTYQDGDVKLFRLPTYISLDESDVSNRMNAVTELPKIEIASDSGLGREPIELWPYLIILLLVLLVVEWGVYYRDEF